jgi:hypothetical protein
VLIQHAACHYGRNDGKDFTRTTNVIHTPDQTTNQEIPTQSVPEEPKLVHNRSTLAIKKDKRNCSAKRPYHKYFVDIREASYENILGRAGLEDESKAGAQDYDAMGKQVKTADNQLLPYRNEKYKAKKWSNNPLTGERQYQNHRDKHRGERDESHSALCGAGTECDVRVRYHQTDMALTDFTPIQCHAASYT